jgi:hypothetical protein
MDIVTAKAAPELPGLFQRALCTLIETVGTSQFAGNLFRVLRDITGCEQMVAFSHSRSNPPQTLLSQNSGVVTNFSLRNEHCVTAFWRHDPVHRLDQESPSDEFYVARLDARDLANRSYREECFKEVGLGSRLSVVRTVASQISVLQPVARDTTRCRHRSAAKRRDRQPKYWATRPRRNVTPSFSDVVPGAWQQPSPHLSMVCQ